MPFKKAIVTPKDQCPVHRLQAKTGPDGAKFNRIYRTKKLHDILQFIEDEVEHNKPNRKITLDAGKLENYLPGCTRVTDDIGQTPLHLAVMWCNHHVVQRLLDVGCKADIPDASGMCPVHCCALFGYKENMALMPRAMWSLPVESSGKQALHLAAMAGNIGVVEFLVQSGAETDPVDKLGQSPLMLASLHQNPDCIQYLFENGAKIELRDKEGVPAVTIVNAGYHNMAESMLDTYVVKDELLEELNVDLSFFLDNNKNFNDNLENNNAMGTLSFYEQSVILSRNMANHVTMRQLTQFKWEEYGKRAFYTRFMIYAAFSSYWTAFYVIPTEKFPDFEGKTAVGYLILAVCLAVISSSAGSVFYNIYKTKQKMMKVKNSSFARFEFETSTQNHLTLPVHANYKRSFLKFQKDNLNPLKIQAANVALIILHVCLLAQSIGKTQHFVNGGDTKTNLFVAFSLVNGAVLIWLWMTLFYFCKVHACIGKFVIFVVQVLKDVGVVGAVFLFLYIPNLAVFYYTVYRFAKPGETEWWKVPFIVARMAVVDYDYDAGVDLTESENITWWWDVYTILWMFVASIVILNLFIALMSDRYATLGSQARYIMAVTRAEFVANLDTFRSPAENDAFNTKCLKYRRIVKVPTDDDDEPENKVGKRLDELEEKLDAITSLLEIINRQKTRTPV